VEQVRLIRSVVGDAVHIKAAGGVRTRETIEVFKAEGVYRVGIGLSSALEVMGQASRIG
jgi:deoxyribose-phosphate aldolase